jgi:two-component system sensor histidine kinase TctE
MNPGAIKQGMTFRSLRVLLGRHVMWPLALTWTLGTVITLAVSLFFTQQAFDRALLDDAYAIASRVSQQKQGLTLELTTKEMGALLFDQSESVFFSVQRQDGSFMAGHPGLRS